MAAPGFTWPNKIPLPSLLRRLSILDLSCRSYQFIAWWCDLIYTFCPFKILTKPSSQQLKISRPCMVVITIYLVLLHSVLPHSLTMLRLWREFFKEGSACSQVNPASTLVRYSIRKTLVKLSNYLSSIFSEYFFCIDRSLCFFLVNGVSMRRFRCACYVGVPANIGKSCSYNYWRQTNIY